MNLIRRHLGAFSVAVVSTVISVVLATVPNWGGTYDASLAVLTATLVAIIWYTFFSYCALHRTSTALVTFRLYSIYPRMIVASVENRSADRTVVMKWRVLGRRNGSDIATGEELRSGTLPISLRPGEVREMNFRFAPAAGVSGNKYGPRVELGEPEEAMVRTEVVWKDDMENKGRIGVDYYAVDVRSVTLRRHQVADLAEEAWRTAGGTTPQPLSV